MKQTLTLGSLYLLAIYTRRLMVTYVSNFIKVFSCSLPVAGLKWAVRDVQWDFENESNKQNLRKRADPTQILSSHVSMIILLTNTWFAWIFKLFVLIRRCIESNTCIQ